MCATVLLQRLQKHHGPVDLYDRRGVLVPLAESEKAHNPRSQYVHPVAIYLASSISHPDRAQPCTSIAIHRGSKRVIAALQEQLAGPESRCVFISWSMPQVEDFYYLDSRSLQSCPGGSDSVHGPLWE